LALGEPADGQGRILSRSPTEKQNPMPTWLIVIVVLVLAVAALLQWGAVKTRAAAALAEREVPPIGTMVEIPHARLHIVDKGRVPPGGRAILMVHGLAGQLHHFNYSLVDEFARETRVVAIDRPGSGYSTREPGHLVALQDQADAIAALIDKLGLGQPLVVGHSLGGAVALTLALRHPGKVAGLALLAPLTHTPEEVPAAFRGLDIPLESLQRFVTSTVAVPIGAFQRERIMAQVFGPETVPGDYDHRAGGMLSLRPSHLLAAAEDMRALVRRMPEIEALYREFNGAQVRLPIHILYGRGDRILNPKFQGESFVRVVPHAKLTVVEGGHMLPVTQGARCAAHIREVMAAI
jgi:pimeloyl-ACP methyl ester carboxylesterase